MTDPFYITTPIFYPNGKLHIGHLYTETVCDVFARMARMVGRPTYFLTGADENSLKIEETAKKHGKGIMEFLDEQSIDFQRLFAEFHISYDQYIRTTDPDVHHIGVIEMWNRIKKAGDIYEGEYEGYYCVGCEGFKTEKDLIDGKCPIHDTVAEFLKEKNYFFRLSKYSDEIKKRIESGEFKITPEARRNEVLAHLEEGLTDISFSRPNKGQPNTIPVPEDPTQAIYVWGDALVNYISALGFGTGATTLFDRFWPATVQIMGKDIIRFHAEIWAGMLLSAGLPLPKEILAHGLLLSGGRKMGKSNGNGIDPEEMIALVGAEGLRFYFAYEVPLTDDGEISKDLIIASYNAHLANGIGNLTNRLLKMAISYDVQFDPYAAKAMPLWDICLSTTRECLKNLDITGYSAFVWKEFAGIDKEIQDTEPFKLFKTDSEKARAIVSEMMMKFYILANFAEPILPHTVPHIVRCIETRTMPEQALFLKI
ncbi:MAG: class I tRNA ligase family protein [Patescibacteria group bacterium]